MSNSDGSGSSSTGDKVVHPPESGSFLDDPRNLIDLEARAYGIKHFGHDHVLTFKEDVRNGVKGKDLCCNVCGIETGSRWFSCDMENCKFLLHEFCASLPKEMKDHPKHPKHPLTLGYCKSNCNVCDRNRHYPFSYQCVPCNFSVDIICASMYIWVYINFHTHRLTVQLYPSSFLCHCCGEKHTELGISYQCRTCSFWLHEECSSLSLKIKHDSHVCQLSLIYFKWSKYSAPKRTCGVCDKNIHLTCSVYGCLRCNYFVHIKCSTEKWDSEIKKVEQDQVKDIFPLSFIEAVQKRLALFIQNKCEWNDTEDKHGDTLNHPSHDHLLTLELDSSKFIRSIDSNDDIAKRGNYKVCDACILPLLDAPLYSCTQSCNFVLHKWCAKLPHELEHPAHTNTGHTLILHEKLDKCFGFFRCNGCEKVGNGFAYKCNKCKDYYLDLRCAALPGFVTYKTHDHPLRLKHRKMSGGCISCGRPNFHECEMPARCDKALLSTDNSPCSPPFSFGCDACHYNICVKCVTLPKKVLHWYDPHGFELTDDVPTQDDNTNLRYHCEFCEKELKEKNWIYHCYECDQCLAAECVRQIFGLLPNPISFGESYYSPYHIELGHKLICIGITKVLGNCERCKTDCFRFGFGFKCKECEIVLGLECASSYV